ncbi:MAG: flagellar filament capping protein FliD [Planctomycetota bacterium]
MGTISSGVGLASGINSQQIIEQLMQIEARPRALYEQRIAGNESRRLAYTTLETRLASLRLAGQQLKLSQRFQAATATSGNDDVVVATASDRAATGSFQVRVAQLASSQQTVSQGFASPTDTLGIGNLTFELGGKGLRSESSINDLRGGQGISAGLFRITDRAGDSAVIDTAGVRDLDELALRISRNTDVNVQADIEDGKLVLTDFTGGSGQLAVRDIDGTAAEELGIDQRVSATTITGAQLDGLAETTTLSSLNDGRGVDVGLNADLTVTLLNGSNFDVDLTDAKTIGDVIERFDDAAGGDATLTISGNRLIINDNTTIPPLGIGQTSVASANGSSAVQDLGLIGSSTTGTFNGRQIVASNGSVLIQSLAGGDGIDTSGGLTVTNRAGVTTNIDTQAEDVAGLIDAINNAGAGVEAQINDAGNGIDLIDLTGGNGDLTMAERGGTTAADLGLLGTFAPNTDPNAPDAKGANLQRQWIYGTTEVADLDGGNGIGAGTLEFTNSNGDVFEVVIDEEDDITNVDDLFAKINDTAASFGVSIGLNDNGDGFTVTDTAGGATQLRINDVEGQIGSALRITGEAETGETTLTGSYETTIEVAASDTLDEVITKINESDAGVAATLLNDGGNTPFRLSLTGRRPGLAGQVLVDGGATSLRTRDLSEASDALAYIGGGADAIAISSKSNTISDAVRGVSFELTGVSDQAINIEVASDTTPVKDQLKALVEGFNTTISEIRSLTDFDVETGRRGQLLGESAVQRIESELYALLRDRVVEGGQYQRLGDIGVNIENGGELTFDEETFNAAYADDPRAVERLFTATTTQLDDEGEEAVVGVGLGWLIEERLDRIVDPVDGIIKRTADAIDEVTRGYEDRIDQLNALLDGKRARLERQFFNMELAIAGLQDQQAAVSSFQPFNFRGTGGGDS